MNRRALHSFAAPAVLAAAIQATFNRRRTEIPTVPPLGLAETFSQDAGKKTQWAAFLRKGHVRVSGAPPRLSDVSRFLVGFLMAPSTALAVDNPFDMAWVPGGPWLPTT